MESPQRRDRTCVPCIDGRFSTTDHQGSAIMNCFGWGFAFIWYSAVDLTEHRRIAERKDEAEKKREKSKVKASVAVENVEKVCACMDSEASLSDFGNEWLREWFFCLFVFFTRPLPVPQRNSGYYSYLAMFFPEHYLNSPNSLLCQQSLYMLSSFLYLETRSPKLVISNMFLSEGAWTKCWRLPLLFIQLF